MMDSFKVKGLSIMPLVSFNAAILILQQSDISHEQSKEIIEYFQKNPNDLNKQCSQGTPPLCWAAYNSHIEIFKALIKIRTGINKANTIGEAPLHYAIGIIDNIEIVQALLEAGADVNLTTNDLRTPLSMALGKGGSFKLIKVLLEAGAIIDAQKSNFLRDNFQHAKLNKNDRQEFFQLIATGSKAAKERRNKFLSKLYEKVPVLTDYDVQNLRLLTCKREVPLTPDTVGHVGKYLAQLNIDSLFKSFPKPERKFLKKKVTETMVVNKVNSFSDAYLSSYKAIQKALSRDKQLRESQNVDGNGYSQTAEDVRKQQKGTSSSERKPTKKF